MLMLIILHNQTASSCFKKDEITTGAQKKRKRNQSEPVAVVVGQEVERHLLTQFTHFVVYNEKLAIPVRAARFYVT